MKRALESGDDPLPWEDAEDKAAKRRREYLRRLWKSGHRLEALIRSYNADRTSQYEEVMIELIKLGFLNE